MNGLGRKKENKTNKNQSVFTKETLGVVLVLFSTLALVCLITRELVFSTPGQVINAFLFGLFGYFAYAVVAFGVIEGVKLVIGKKSKWTFKRKALFTLWAVSLCLIVHVITLHGKGLSFGEYLTTSYNMAQGGFLTASGGGIVMALVAFPVISLLTEVGTYVVFGIVFATISFFLGKDIYLSFKGAKNEPKEKFKSSYVPTEPQQVEQAPKQTDVQPEIEKPVQKVVEPVQTVAQQPSQNSDKPVQRLFVNNPQDFQLKNKREMANPDQSAKIKLGFSNGGLGVATSPEETPTLKDDADYKSKLDYIKTPPNIDLNAMRTNVRPNVGNNGTGYSVPQQPSQTTVSNYVNVRPQVDPEPEVNEKQSEIPFIEHSSGVTVSGASVDERAETFGRYADFEDVKPVVNAPIEEDVVFRGVKDVEENIEPEKPVGEIPFIEEIYGDDDENNPSNVDSPRQRVDNEPEPPLTSVRGERVKGIFDQPEIDIEKAEDVETENTSVAARRVTPGFTSRVDADGNSSSRSRGVENLTPDEPAEEKPQKPQPPINREYFRPPIDMLENYEPPVDAPKENHQERMDIIRQTLEEFHINVTPTGYVQGPAITRYEIMMPPGVSVKKVTGFDADLKMKLLAENDIRIEAPIPGKNLVGIEVANSIKTKVGLREVLQESAGMKIKDGSLMFALGKDIVGKPVLDDLTEGPHYLVAGATGAGKSVCLNTMIISLIMRYSPEDLRLILVDPKGVEFTNYEHIPHLMIDEIITEPKKTLAVLTWAYAEMQRRFLLFREKGEGKVVDINGYNKYVASDTVPKMPRLVIIIDELADLMETCKKDLESKIRAIAQKSRAAGIHLVLATQRPSVDIITGTIKANLPSRIAFKVMNFNDSQTILSEAGAEKLLGYGDMLYKTARMAAPARYQGAFISSIEINSIVNYVKEKNTAYFDDELQEYLDKESRPPQEEAPVDDGGAGGDNSENDALFLKALWLAVTSNSVSISQLQRRYRIGYSRAGAIVDTMEQMGFVSANEGSKARRVLLTREEFEERFGPMSE